MELLNWFSYFVKYPSEKQTCIILTGEEGSGKTLLIDWFGIHVLGLKYFTSVNNINEMICKFNSHIAGALLVNVQELKSNDNPNSLWETKKQTDGVKSVITDRYMKVEHKGLEPKTILNSAKVIMTTNHKQQILYITPNSRRFNIFETSSIYLRNWEYFKTLDLSLNQDVANHFFTFLLNREITDDIQKIQYTEALEECIDSCKQPIEQFLDAFLCINNNCWKYEKKDLYSGKCIYNYESPDKTLYYIIQKQDFYEIYKAWVDSNYVMSSNNFFQRINACIKTPNYAKFFGRDYTDKKNGGKTYYRLLPNSLNTKYTDDKGDICICYWINKPTKYFNNTLDSNNNSNVSTPTQSSTPSPIQSPAPIVKRGMAGFLQRNNKIVNAEESDE